jgi:hypothetical protein
MNKAVYNIVVNHRSEMKLMIDLYYISHGYTHFSFFNLHLISDLLNYIDILYMILSSVVVNIKDDIFITRQS